jgi:hypothetical protein
VKKVLALILLIVYGFTSSGAAVDLHYCMGKLVGIDFHFDSGKQCSKCSMPVKDSKGCCHNKQVQSNIDKYHQATLKSSFGNAFPDALIIPFSYADFSLNSVVAENSFHSGPPLILSKPLYLLNRNFRI